MCRARAHVPAMQKGNLRLLQAPLCHRQKSSRLRQKALGCLNYAAKPKQRTSTKTHLDVPALAARTHAGHADALGFRQAPVPGLQTFLCLCSRQEVETKRLFAAPPPQAEAI